MTFESGSIHGANTPANVVMDAKVTAEQRRSSSFMFVTAVDGTRVTVDRSWA